MRLLIVAAPMVSRGGVYSWLGEASPILREAGWTVGLLWTRPGRGRPDPADWEARLEESGGEAHPGPRPAASGRCRRCLLPARPRAFGPPSVRSRLRQGRRGEGAMDGDGPRPALPCAGEGGAVRRLAWRRAVGWAYRRADRIVAVSDASRQDAARGPRSRTDHHGSQRGPDPADRRSFALAEDAPSAFSAASRPRRPPTSSSRPSMESTCDARVFGDGPLAAKTGRAARLANVTVEGWADRDLALDADRPTAAPSRREAFPLACIEAGARGIPVLARDVGGIGEVLGADPELRRHCLLPTTASSAEFGERLQAFLDDVDLRLDIGRRLRETVAGRFALPGQVLELDRLLAKPSAVQGAGSL